MNQPTPTLTVATMNRTVLYDDGSERVQVSFDSAYRLSADDDSYVRISGVGEDTLIRVSDIPFLIDALQEAQRLDDLARSGTAA